MEVLAENGIKLTFVNLEEFESDTELKRAIKHFSESLTPYIEAVIDENESYSTVTVTVPEEWEKNCIFLFEELYEKLHYKGLDLVRYSPPGYSISGSSFKEVTFFLPFLYEERIKIAKEIARLAHECISSKTDEIAGEIRRAGEMQYVVIRNSHEFWCNDYKGGDKIVEYCLRYRMPYIQVGLGFPYSRSTRARIDIYFLKEWIEKNQDLPERIKKKLIEFVYSEPIETDIIAHSPPVWFVNHYGYRSDWWGITTPDFVIIPAVTTTQKKADDVARAVVRIVAECLEGVNF